MTPVFALRQDDGPELDLDSPAVAPGGRRRHRGLLALLVAGLLLGAGAGAVTRTLTAGTPPPPLPQANLAFAEAHLDGDTIATLRLTVHNSAATAVTVTEFEADGIRTERITAPVRKTVAPDSTAAFLVPVAADCSRTLVFKALQARLRMSDGTVVPAVPERALGSAGGLCRQLRAALPDGWWDPWAGVTLRPVGGYLELTLPPLDPSASLAGVWVGKTILAYAAPAEPVGNRYKPILLVPPRDCVIANGERLPTGIRVLLTGDGGLRNRYVVIGPELARWLLQRC